SRVGDVFRRRLQFDTGLADGGSRGPVEVEGLDCKGIGGTDIHATLPQGDCRLLAQRVWACADWHQQALRARPVSQFHRERAPPSGDGVWTGSAAPRWRRRMWPAVAAPVQEGGGLIAGRNIWGGEAGVSRCRWCGLPCHSAVLAEYKPGVA